MGREIDQGNAITMEEVADPTVYSFPAKRAVMASQVSRVRRAVSLILGETSHEPCSHDTDLLRFWGRSDGDRRPPPHAWMSLAHIPGCHRLARPDVIADHEDRQGRGDPARCLGDGSHR